MNEQRQANRRLLRRMVFVAAAMFAFGVFGMPPLYDRFCEITGIGQAGVRTAEFAPTGAAQDRTVRVRFDATTNSALPWHFKPGVNVMEVQVGVPTEASYKVTNLNEIDITGRAVYNVTPPEAGLYFVKTECFCFSSQPLAAGEHRDLPVRFYIDPDLPEEIGELTLSYTFFLDQDSPGMAGLNAAGKPVN